LKFLGLVIHSSRAWVWTFTPTGASCYFFGFVIGIGETIPVEGGGQVG